jgi:subtilase family serine protease
MATKKILFLTVILTLLIYSLPAFPDQVIIPHSGILQPGDTGKARTHFRLVIPDGGLEKLNANIRANPTPQESPPHTGYGYETPASLACVYKLTSSANSQCNPNSVTTNATGGSRAIAVVDAYNYPSAVTDLQSFSTQFGLPAPNVTVEYANGTPPNDPYGWELEAALDLQWAHAMAPNAQLYLVIAASNSTSNLLAAVDKASSLVQAAGGGEVSMSWGRREFSDEENYESHFQTSGVVYFASSGDNPGTQWPCVSPSVVCVGGTTLRRNTATLNFFQEVSWDYTGGGSSFYFSRPSYQKGIAKRVGTQRGVPDVSLAADPLSGGWVFYTPSDGSGSAWWIVGGTSWSSPSFAGIVNNAGNFYSSSNAELTKIYAGGWSNFRDINAGYCGPYVGLSAVSGWDFCTGVGSSTGKKGK